MTYIEQSVTFLLALKVNYDLLFSNLVWSKYIYQENLAFDEAVFDCWSHKENILRL